MGSISSHTRPVECVQGKIISKTSAILYTGDTMGVIKVWQISKDSEFGSRWNASLECELNYHRTRINDMVYSNGQLWTGMYALIVK